MSNQPDPECPFFFYPSLLNQLVAALERDGATALGVTDFGVNCTSLEDVFLKINENSLERLHAQELALARRRLES